MTKVPGWYADLTYDDKPEGTFGPFGSEAEANAAVDRHFPYGIPAGFVVVVYRVD